MNNTLECPIRLFVLCIAAFAIGCGDQSDQPELGNVSGKVTLNGEPLRQTEITFSPTSGRPSFGTTNDEGRYQLNYIRDLPGASLGQHTITIRDDRVDQSKLQPAEVKPGDNVIDIQCVAISQSSPTHAGER